MRDRETNKGKGIGFVLFKSKEAARAALNLNGAKLKDREVRVRYAYPVFHVIPHITPFRAYKLLAWWYNPNPVGTTLFCYRRLLSKVALIIMSRPIIMIGWLLSSVGWMERL